MPGSVHNQRGIIKPRSLSSIKSDENYDSDESDEGDKDAVFYVRRITMCVLSVGLMFLFGYFAMKWRGGELEVSTEVAKITCDPLEGIVTYPHYRIQVQHTDGIPHLHVRHLHQDNDTILTIGGINTADVSGSTPVIDHTQCNTGKFSTHLISRYQLSCNTLTEGWHLWNSLLDDDTVVCHLQIRSNESFAELHVSQVDPFPSCVDNVFPSLCIGDNISIATSTDLIDVAKTDNTSIIKLPTYPQGMYNRSVQFALFF
eukprot:TRINITY_DN13387_c0_g1_i1.p1 TRINITY_DN13387_c0_g1~~TRINITY_DN13387_c0_g1_i1.p1  ORF type:complete len:258 (+),score=21.14 TRINITY_DN13387_c0_g1_i1:51-824(+)